MRILSGLAFIGAAAQDPLTKNTPQPWTRPDIKQLKARCPRGDGKGQCTKTKRELCEKHNGHWDDPAVRCGMWSKRYRNLCCIKPGKEHGKGKEQGKIRCPIGNAKVTFNEHSQYHVQCEPGHYIKNNKKGILFEQALYNYDADDHSLKKGEGYEDQAPTLKCGESECREKCSTMDLGNQQDLVVIPSYFENQGLAKKPLLIGESSMLICKWGDQSKPIYIECKKRKGVAAIYTEPGSTNFIDSCPEPVESEQNEDAWLIRIFNYFRR